MRSPTARTSSKSKPDAGRPVAPADSGVLQDVLTCLDEAKAEDIVTIDIKGKSTIGDFMVVASGRTDRHVGAIADQVREKLKEAGVAGVRMEGQDNCDWVIVDGGDIIVHIFRPEVREFYNIEKMWQSERPPEPPTH
ncbi:MAG TPA: ribosome silencing factor [Hyphomicrobiaceae bacterium]|nr:ribosome silencing factor [Hyphomicrobiaceae bacterium]